MEDFISQLPNHLLHKILLNLRTSESVRTSVLSTRWRHLWQNVPGLIFEGYESDLNDFMEKFLNVHKELPIYRFTLGCMNVDIPFWNLLIDKVLTRVQLLNVNGKPSFARRGLRVIKLPTSFYTCETLVNLHLQHVTLSDFDGSEFINLPRLQVMHLEFVLIPSDVVLEMLISCSPVLQELRLYMLQVGSVKVRSHTLRRLSFTGMPNDSGECRVVIDTPNLEFLAIRYIVLENFRVESVGSSIKICLGMRCHLNMQIFQKFFAEISQVTDLSISGSTLEGIYYSTVSQYEEQLPELKNLTRLYAYFIPSVSEMLPLYLSSCPNLKFVALEFDYFQNMENIANSPVPQCLQTSIENVEIKMTPKAWNKSSRKTQVELAKYILDNAKALKKFTLYLEEKEDVCNSVLEQILTFQNRPSVEVKIRVAPPNPCLGFTFKLPRFFSGSLSSSYWNT